MYINKQQTNIASLIKVIPHINYILAGNWLHFVKKKRLIKNMKITSKKMLFYTKKNSNFKLNTEIRQLSNNINNALQ
jgi:hypothetical protein